MRSEKENNLIGFGQDSHFSASSGALHSGLPLAGIPVPLFPGLSSDSDADNDSDRVFSLRSIHGQPTKQVLDNISQDLLRRHLGGDGMHERAFSVAAEKHMEVIVGRHSGCF
jgi:hypothetical protein